MRRLKKEKSPPCLTLTLEELKKLYNDAVFQEEYNDMLPWIHISTDGDCIIICQPPVYLGQKIHYHYNTKDK
ncbi:hypothetical protein [Eubacterium sp. 1001713B170207_170306_E7]|uniref:hypothetical protein n=1 Tax=Eubacterium sp. 1001713B170207_170306_E7 TaxID=2787097 RepID=UPI00189A1C89|nr:hypothetical protein [Eubacterium sp. 1001713B170207_170306_E7]